MTRSVGFLRKHEVLSDLMFVCAFNGKLKTVKAHQMVFVEKSKFLTQWFQFAQKVMVIQTLFRTNSVMTWPLFQPGQPAQVILDDIDPVLVEKLLDYFYHGQMTLQRRHKEAMRCLFKSLDMDVDVQEPVSSESSSSSAEEESEKETPKKKLVTPTLIKSRSASPKEDSPPPKKGRGRPSGKGRRSSMGPKSKKVEEVEKETSDKESSSDESTTTKDLKKKARNSKTTISLDDVDKSEDPEIKKYLGKATSSETPAPVESKKAANPLFAGNKQTPQKRRMAEPDKKVETKESKKMRQDESSSDVDSDAVAKRKSESLIKKRSPSPAAPQSPKVKRDIATSDSDSPPPASKSRPTAETSKESKTEEKKEETNPAKKKKPGPASRKIKKEPKEVPQLFATEEIKYCNFCGAIFVSSTALENHKKDCGGEDDDSDGSSDVSSESSANESPEKKSPPTKKSPAKIKEERRKSRRSPSDDDTDDEPSPPRKQATKSPRGRPPKIRLKDPVSDGKDTPKAQRRKSNAISAGGDSTPGPGEIGCFFCSESFDKPGNLKNHVVNHFKDELLSGLPSAKPFNCPDCGNLSRDKITLLRHYAFTHRHLYEHCTEIEAAGKRPDGSARKTKISSTPRTPKSSTTDKAKSKILLSSDSSSDEEQSTKKKRSKAAESDEDTAKKSAEKADSPEPEKPVKNDNAPKVSATFSDSDDADFASTANSASQAIKTFDDLFGDEDKGEKEKKKEDKVVFNKDSDGSDNEAPKENGKAAKVNGEDG